MIRQLRDLKMSNTSGYEINPDETPITYQQEDTSLVFRIMRAGESQALVGVGSSGKSNFVAHFARREVKAHYISGIPPFYIVVLLNPHHMVHLEGNALQHTGSLWAGYELMVNRLRYSLQDLQDEPTISESERAELARVIVRINELYKNIYHPHSLKAQSSFRRLEDVTEEILTTDDRWRIIFVFDEYEQFLRHLPVEFFQSLRGLRDDHKRRVMYITVGRATPHELLLQIDVEKQSTIESFSELFNDFTNYLRPLDDRSARYVIERYAHYYDRHELSEFHKTLLCDVTGQHPGLIRRAFLPLLQESMRLQLTHEQYAETLARYGPVRKECATIYDSLSDREQTAIMEIAVKGSSRDPESLYSLTCKHLLNNEGREIRIPILRAFLKTLNP
jgi:hypothetical protein